MNCIIIDNDYQSAKSFEGYVNRFSSLKLIGTIDNQADAINVISKWPGIELIIFDIETIGTKGIDFLSKLDPSILIIIISSSQEYALKAFEFNVVDYLIKPVNCWRFFKAIDRAAIRKSAFKVVSSPEEEEIFIKNGASLVKQKIKDILYIEALENYVMLYTINNRFTIHFTMRAIESQLPADIFIRVHRSLIINKNIIRTINENTVNLNVGNSLKSFPVGKSFRKALLNNISLIAC